MPYLPNLYDPNLAFALSEQLDTCTSVFFVVENPICDEDDYRLEVLVSLRNLERLDKDELTEEERQEAQDTYAQRREQQLEEAQQVWRIMKRDEHHLIGRGRGLA